MDHVDGWRQCFQDWPGDVNRRGVLVTTFAEQIPFVNFLASDRMILLERQSPDQVGARMVMLPYQNIAALKIIDVVKARVFSHMGFAPAPAPPASKK
ncbi:MAG: hypothetical protein AB7O59_25385 [Pirellulales bacterium]